MPVAELMKKLGIAKYSMNPKMPDFTAQRPLIDKYGMTGASEVIDFKIGPYCTNNSCRIPYGIKVGIDIPASVFVSFNAGSHQIEAIDVAINSLNWDDFVQILKRKYGSAWKSETMPMSIMDYETKESLTFEREMLTHETGGKNSKTQDTCEISEIGRAHV